uniref:Uncharacterized protein n=1 Tax=Arundo donax TaxID=35708 RepID=A0A0A9AHY9_ARUDO
MTEHEGHKLVLMCLLPSLVSVNTNCNTVS